MGEHPVMDEKKYDVEAVKNRLVEYRERERDIDNQIERVEWLEMKMTSIGSPTISDMPKAASPSHDKIGSMIAQKEELETCIREDIKKQESERAEIEAILKKLKHSDERAVIRMRYFDGASWNDVVDMLFGAKNDFLGKEDTYLRRTHKIHGSALLNMAIYIEESPNPDNTPTL